MVTVEQTPRPAPPSPYVGQPWVAPVPEPIVSDPTMRGFLRAAPGIFYREWGRIEVQALAAQVAYSLLFAIPALALMTMSLAAFVDRRLHVPVAERLQDWIVTYAPKQMEELLAYIVDRAIKETAGSQISLQLVLAIVLGVWTASNGIGALINATNRAYGLIDTRAYHVRRGRIIGITVVVSALTIVGLVLFITGQAFGSRVATRFNLGNTYDQLWFHARWPLTVIALGLALLGLYRFGPMVPLPLFWSLPGALVGTGLWLLALFGFQYYLSFTNPGSPYGVTGSIIVLMLFLYYTGVVFIVGAMTNGVLYRYFRSKGICLAP